MNRFHDKFYNKFFLIGKMESHIYATLVKNGEIPPIDTVLKVHQKVFKSINDAREALKSSALIYQGCPTIATYLTSLTSSDKYVIWVIPDTSTVYIDLTGLWKGPNNIDWSIFNTIGRHVEKQKNFSLTIQTQTLPFQFFASNPRSCVIPKRDLSDDIQALTGKIVQKGWIHAPYTINLSNPTENAVPCLQHLLALCEPLHLQGVVVHVGKDIKELRGAGFNNMLANTRLSLSKSAPLLIETPAGQGTELLTDIKQFIGFWAHFSEYKMTNGDNALKICVDTCHVFALGYDPLDYVQQIIGAVGAKNVPLIHLNDSADARGSRKDRHAPIGHGQIGWFKLYQVAKLAYENGISCVVE